MNSGNDEQRWRSSNANQRGQGGQRRNMPRDGPSYSGGQAYNQNSSNNNNNGNNNSNNNNNSSSNGNTNAWAGGRNMNHHMQQQQQDAYYDPHVPVNGFNPQDALEFLTRGYDINLQAARAPGQDGEKPVIYKGEKGWSTPSKGNTGSAWGQKRNAMASGGDFLVQLKKSHAAFLQKGAE